MFLVLILETLALCAADFVMHLYVTSLKNFIVDYLIKNLTRSFFRVFTLESIPSLKPSSLGIIQSPC